MHTEKKKGLNLSGKTLIIILALSLVLLTLACIISYYVYTKTMDKHYSNMATSIADTAANVIDKDEVRALSDKIIERYESLDEPVSSEEYGTDRFNAYIDKYSDLYSSDEYNSILSDLQKVLEAFNQDISSLYIAYMYEPDHIGFYVVDASNVEPCMPGTFDIIGEDFYYIFDTPEVGFPAYKTISDEYGYLVSVGRPVYDDDGSVMAYSYVDIQMSEVLNDRAAFLKTLMMTMIAATFVLCLIIIVIINKNIVKPIKELSDAAISYVKGKANNSGSHFTGVVAKTGDEIEDLGEAMISMEDDINEYIDNLQTVTAEKERIGAELNVATKIQMDMLPNIFPTFNKRNDFEIYASMDPAKEVGGDFYDFFFIDEGHVALVAADVSGKGVPAALFMVIAKTLIKNRTLMGGTPGEILTDVNNQLSESNASNMFVTVWLAIVDLKTGDMLTANAGHEYPGIRRANGEFQLVMSRHGLALAAMEGLKYKTNTFKLNEGDSIFAYTDGVTEATDKNKNLFGNDRLIEALNINPASSPTELIATVRKSIDAFVGDAEQFDDITMLSFKLLKYQD